jgi:hypothetical protein
MPWRKLVEDLPLFAPLLLFPEASVEGDALAPTSPRLLLAVELLRPPVLLDEDEETAAEESLVVVP